MKRALDRLKQEKVHLVFYSCPSDVQLMVDALYGQRETKKIAAHYHKNESKSMEQ